ncbi:MAG: translocation/assembly module TamB, partial [Paludibacter sp.]|nr:translocation/assembly module TamB [Paludibacter sp.]
QNNKTYSLDSISIKATKLTGQTEVKLRSDILEMDTYLAFKKDHIRLNFNPDHFLLMQKHWKFNPEHSIQLGEKGFIIHDLQMQHEEGILGITSVNERYKDDIRITMQHFSLDEISGLINQENKFVGGTLNGNVLLKMQEGFGIVADAGIDSLILMDVPIGNLRLTAQNPVASRFDVQVDISGADNNLQVSGFYDTGEEGNNFCLKANIASLGMKTIEAFAAGQLRTSSGHASGLFDISGDLNKPLINGELSFHEAVTTPVMLNNPLSLANETIRVDNEGVYFKQFTIRDIKNQPLALDGSIRMKDFADFKFNLNVDANHFQVFNTTARDNDLFYGRLLTDTKIRLRGTMDAPDVSADVSLLDGSHVSFIVPRTELNTYKGEDVVEFVSGEEKKDSLIKSNKIESGFTGINLSSVIQVDKNATLRLFMDPSSSDSLVVKGQADLNLTMDRSGKMSLTGSYNLEEGSYQLTFESLIRKKFDIVKGSTIVWNGDPMDANVNINAAYNVRTAPYNLVADQLGGLTENQKRPYLQAYPFMLLLKMRGELLQPEIGFEIQLPAENQQILGGAIQQKLDQLNEDPSALNKQVFALLLLNRFAQENPLQTESAGTPAMLRSTVSNFLSQQLNKLSASFIPGLEMNFDLQSYEDYSDGEAEGRTELSVGVKKELFDERLSVQVGGTVELEGEKATQNQASDIASDVIIEYKLTKDGRYRLKGFRKNQYEGLIDGQLTETGIGAVLVREFNRLKELFK